MFGLHTLHYHKYFGKEFCSGEDYVTVVYLGSGSVMNVLSTLILFPVYILVTVGGFCKKISGFFQRIFIGTILCLMGVTSMLIIDVVGHVLQSGTATSNHTQCMFQFYRTSHTLSYPSLNMHWSVLIPPSIFLGFGPVYIDHDSFFRIHLSSKPSVNEGISYWHLLCNPRVFSIS